MNWLSAINSVAENNKALLFFIFLAIELIVFYPLLALFKWSLLGLINVSEKEKIAIFSNRKRNFDLRHLINTYGDRNLRIIDGLSRKLLHIATGCWRLAILTFLIKDTQVTFKVTIIFQVIAISLFIFSYSSNRIFGLAGMIYGATSRIRDGIYGRKNILIAQFSFLSFLPLIILEGLAVDKLADSSYLLLLPLFIFLPITIGDALGEIIGTIWGKQRLKVWGFGEINRKSMLGTASVFFGSLIPLMTIVYLNNLAWPWLLLCLSISLTTTVVELVAPRGTDNFCIPLGNALVCLFFINNFAAI